MQTVKELESIRGESLIQSNLPEPSYVVDYFAPDEAAILFQEENPIRKTSREREFTQSIYESYNAFNEAERIQKLQHLTPEEKSYYISENVISYLEEFVGKIRIKKLSGVLKEDDSMEMLGTNLTEMYNHAAYLAGEESREYSEKKGLDLIAQRLNEGNNRAIWISPPKLANYGFAFTFIVDNYDPDLGGRPFREMLLRYDEPLKSIKTSKSVHSSLVNRIGLNEPDSSQFTSDLDFLAHPLVYKHDEFADIEALYEYLDISPEDVRHSEEFRLQVMPVIDTYLHQYIDIIQQMSAYDLSHPNMQFRQLEQDANNIIGAMFNIGRMINRQMSIVDTPKERLEQDSLQLQQLSRVSNQQEMMMMARHMAGYEELVISGGSNCPVVQTGIMESQLFTNIGSGMSISMGMQGVGMESSKKKDPWKCVTCPNCEESVNAIVTRTTIKCPQCKHTVKRK